MSRTSTMCTSIHMSIHRIMCVSKMSMFLAKFEFLSCFVFMHMRSMFLAKHGFQSCVVYGTLAQSGAQTIYTLLQSTYIIFNNWRRCGVRNIFINRRKDNRNMTNMSIKIIFQRSVFFWNKFQFFWNQSNFIFQITLLKQNRVLKTKPHYSSKHHNNHLLAHKVTLSNCLEFWW